MDNVYLDHAASTPVDADILSDYCQLLTRLYANPSSLHAMGREAENSLQASRQSLRKALDLRQGRIVFTSGGSESINLAIQGYLAAHAGLPRRVLTTQGEHAATSATLRHLALQGYEIEALRLQKDGTVDLGELEKALQTPAALLTLLHVNNEVGAENPLEAILKLKNKLQPKLAVHLDAVQTFGKTHFSFRRYPVDMVSASGHKIGAPKGCGFLALASGIRLVAQIHGGGQQEGLRSGTENPPLAKALASALTLQQNQQEENCRKASLLRTRLLERLKAQGVVFEEHAAASAVPQILSLSLDGLLSEPLINLLSSMGVHASAGSACSSRQKKKQNTVARAMGLMPRQIDSAIRLSFARSTTEEDIDRAAEAIGQCKKMLIHA